MDVAKTLPQAWLACAYAAAVSGSEGLRTTQECNDEGTVKMDNFTLNIEDGDNLMRMKGKMKREVDLERVEKTFGLVSSGDGGRD